MYLWRNSMTLALFLFANIKIQKHSTGLHDSPMNVCWNCSIWSMFFPLDLFQRIHPKLVYRKHWDATTKWHGHLGFWCWALSDAWCNRKTFISQQSFLLQNNDPENLLACSFPVLHTVVLSICFPVQETRPVSYDFSSYDTCLIWLTIFNGKNKLFLLFRGMTERTYHDELPVLCLNASGMFLFRLVNPFPFT